MIAGPPAGGKTLLAADYVLRAGLPTLYVSADTDSHTMIARAGAKLLQATVSEVEAMLERGESDSVEQAFEDELRHVAWYFDPSPSLEDIDAEICAFEEMWGQYPELIVIDSLYNINADAGDEWAAMREISKALHHLARASEASVLVLHHVSEGEGKPNLPAARKAILGKLAQLPELILTVALDAAMGQFRVAAVKNRSGPADATGKSFSTLYADPARMLISDDAAVIQRAKQGVTWT